MTKFEINGVELAVNMLDADENERVTAAVLASGREATEAAAKEYASEAEGIRAVCRVVARCFDAVFGDGTGEKVLGGKSDISVAVDAQTRLIDAVSRDAEDFRTYSANLQKRYSPARAQREKK